MREGKSRRGVLIYGGLSSMRKVSWKIIVRYGQSSSSAMGNKDIVPL